GQMVQSFLASWVPNSKYVPAGDIVGTSAPRDRIFREADAPNVLVIDSHVFLRRCGITIPRLIDYMERHGEAGALLEGPLVYDGLNSSSTHFDDVWRSEMWGTWGTAWECRCGKDLFSCFQGSGGGLETRLLLPEGERPLYRGCVKCGCMVPAVDFPAH